MKMGRDLFSKNIEKIKEILFTKKMYSQKELNTILMQLKQKGLIAQDTSSRIFFEKLQTKLDIKTHSVVSDKINKVRYTFNSDSNIYDIVASFEKNSFFPMSTALNIQELHTCRDNFIFYAKELSEKHANNEDLHQDSIDKAYKRNYRYTSNIAKIENKNIVYLMPKHTGRFEVINYKGYSVSSINRAFVEMIVNVQYYKTFEIVIQCFKPLKNKIDTDTVFKVVEVFNFTYPYFQLVGYALEKIGFTKEELLPFKEKVSDLKFYTEKNKKEYYFDKYWNIYFTS